MGLVVIAVFMSLMRRVCSGRIIIIPSVELIRKTSRFHSRKMHQVSQEAMDTKSRSLSSQSLAAKAVVAQLLPPQLKVQQRVRSRLASQSPTLLPTPTVQSLQRLARPLLILAPITVKVALTLAPLSPV